MASEQMYRENILDHYKRPRNKGTLVSADSEGFDSNPLCGDEIGMQISVKGGKVADIKFSGSACAICTASASMITEEVKGKKLEAARKVSKEQVLAMLGIDPGPTRLKCALLPLKVMKLAVYKYLGKKMSEEDEKLV
ncbi:MAG: SUF system NifU family Fe-S cluster assembly protein [Candidatus Micrarchaeota archaeon]|nr:SUF system NifU family Fe-S cluster assembly protein [Candidatus Micrarchaeota archaeon]